MYIFSKDKCKQKLTNIRLTYSVYHIKPSTAAHWRLCECVSNFSCVKLQITQRLFKHDCMHNPTGGICISHTHPHDSYRGGVLWELVSGISQLIERRGEGGGEGGRSRRPWAAEEVKTYWKSVHREHFCPTWAKQHAQTAATALFSQPCFMLRGIVHTVSRQTLLTSHWFHQLGCERWRPDLLGNVKHCVHKEIQCDLR